MDNSLLILGAGGHGRSIAELAALTGIYSNIAFLDDSWEPNAPSLPPIVGRMDHLKKNQASFTHAIIGIGNNSIREQLHVQLQEEGLALATLVHPRACVSPSALLGKGSVVFAGVVIGANVRAGEGTIINCNSTVDHDGVLEDFAHLGVGVQLAGGCHIGKGAFVQAGSRGGFGAFAEAFAVCAPGSTLNSRA
ncbi:sugar O-acyltransferase [Dryocola sp. LX212]